MRLRRLIRVALPLLAIALACLVVWQLYSNWVADLRSSSRIFDGRTPGFKESPEEIRARHAGYGGSEHLDVMRRDKSGRLIMRFFADRVEHVTKTESLVTRPRVQYFSKDGETIALAGDEARIVRAKAEGLTLEDVRSGTVRGNVVLTHDRGTPDDSLDDVYVTLDELAFDNQTYEMTTDGPVILVSSDMDLTARRMRIVMDKATGRISAMTFYEEILATFAKGERLRMRLLEAPKEGPPAEPNPAPAGTAAEPDAAPVATPVEPSAAPSNDPERRPEVDPPGRGRRGAEPGDVPAEPAPPRPVRPAEPAPAEAPPKAPLAAEPAPPQPGPPAGPAPPEPSSPDIAAQPTPAVTEPRVQRAAPLEEAREVWQIDLAGDVDARQMDQRLLCERLRIYSETAAPSDREPAKPAAAPPPAEEGTPVPEAPPLVVIAEGPLIITPVDAAERKTLGDAVYAMTAIGAPAAVMDGRLAAKGAEIVYNTRTGNGHVDGGDQPILIEEPDRLRLVGGRLEFGREPARARFVGRGDLEARVATQGLTGIQPRATEAEAPALLQATWEEGMDLDFFPLAADAPSGSVPEIRRTQFRGQASIKQEDGSLRGNHLVIDFYPSEVRRYAMAMPAIGEGCSAARILQWKVKAGEKIGRGDTLAVVEAAPAPGPAGPTGEPGAPSAPATTSAPASSPAAAGGAANTRRAPPRKAELKCTRDGYVKSVEAAAGDVVPCGKIILLLDARSTQAVERLQGHGDVFVENKAADEGKAQGLGQVGDIRCQDLDVAFSRSPDGGSQPKELKASGDVSIHDPKGKVRAGDLVVRLARDKEGRLEADFLEARGAVVVDREDLYAQGDYIKRDVPRSLLVLEGKPAVASRPGRRIAGDSIEFLETEGKATVRGRGEIEMPAATDLRGRQAGQTRTLRVQWSQGMYLEDARHFANFDGDVVASAGPGLLESQKLWIYFKEPPAEDPPAPPPAGGQAPKPDDVAKAEAAPAESEDLARAKSIERVLAEGKVRAVEQPIDDDGGVGMRMELTGEDLTYLQESRKAYMRKPGHLAILARDPPQSGKRGPRLSPEEAAAVREGDAPPGYSWMTVSWADSMAYDDSIAQVFFKGGVEAAYAGRAALGGGLTKPDEASRLRIQSGVLQVVFDRDDAPPPSSAAPGLAGLAGAAAGNTTASPSAAVGRTAPPGPLGERMDVKTLLADQGVRIWLNERRGSGHRLMYQRKPEEIVRLFSGPQGLARLWQEDEAKQEFGTVAAQTITYHPATGRVDVMGQQIIAGAKP